MGDKYPRTKWADDICASSHGLSTQINFTARFVHTHRDILEPWPTYVCIDINQT